MVRAAALGVIDYSRADPNDINWRLRHRLLIQEVQRQDDHRLLAAVHRHWLSHVAHGSLTEESYTNVKERANEALEALQHTIYPWIAQEESEGEKVTIDPEIEALAAQYKQFKASLQNEQDK